MVTSTESAPPKPQDEYLAKLVGDENTVLRQVHGTLPQVGAAIAEFQGMIAGCSHSNLSFSLHNMQGPKETDPTLALQAHAVWLGLSGRK